MHCKVFFQIQIFEFYVAITYYYYSVNCLLAFVVRFKGLKRFLRNHFVYPFSFKLFIKGILIQLIYKRLPGNSHALKVYLKSELKSHMKLFRNLSK